MYITALSPDSETGENRLLLYDADGYSLVTGARLVTHRRLDAICYLFDATKRAGIARLHGLQDAGEFGRAREEADAGKVHPAA
jgi:hypothetical protein